MIFARREIIEDENLRKEFQQMRTNQQLKDEMLKILSQSKFEMGLGKCQQQLEELLAIAKRKEEIAKIVDSYAVFNSLALCWGLSQCIAFVQKDQEAREQATRYNKEFGEWAQIMGPEAVEYKMDLEENLQSLSEYSELTELNGNCLEKTCLWICSSKLPF